MKADEELTRKLFAAAHRLVDERERKFNPLYNVSVYTYEAAQNAKTQWCWANNGVAYTSLSFAKLIDCLEFENKPDLSALPVLEHAKRWIFLGSPQGVEGFSSIGVNPTDKDRERLDLQAYIQLYDLEGIELNEKRQIIQEAYSTRNLITMIDQPGGKTKIPGKFFDRVYGAVREQQEQLFIIDVFSPETGDWHGKNNFCVAVM